MDQQARHHTVEMGKVSTVRKALAELIFNLFKCKLCEAHLKDKPKSKPMHFTDSK